MKKYTKWVALGTFHRIADYVVMVRKNNKTGMLRFKVKRIHGSLLFRNCETFFFAEIDTQSVWDKITKQD